MDRRDLSIILIFLMLSVGGGLPQAIHWKVDHGCCGSTACTIETAETHQRASDAGTPCCPHHLYTNDHDTPSEPTPAPSHETAPAADSQGELADADLVNEGSPMSNEHDCSICQFLATLTAIVAPTFITPVHVDPIQWTVGDPGTTVVTIERISSHGPRAPPRAV